MTMNATKAEVLTENPTMKAMVDRFLNWKLPQSFQPDCGISFNPHPGTWPIGTNVFTATEARQMLEHVVGAELTSLRASRDEWQKAVEAKHKWMVEADAEIKRLEGELASRPALVKAAEMARDWCNHKRIIAVIREKYNIPDTQNCEKFIYDKLDAALAQVSAPAPAPAKELTFDDFRRINAARSARWDANAKPELEFAGVELAGEVGEVCNAVKKLARHRMGMKGGVADTTNLAEELGDVVICADLLAMRTGINLGEAVAKKFNATSEKHGFPERLPSASPAPSREQAPSDAKEAKGEVCRNCGGRGFVGYGGAYRECPSCHPDNEPISSTPAPAAPATSGAGEQYEGVRVWKDCDGDIWIANESNAWVHFQKRNDVCRQTSVTNITETIRSLDVLFSPYTELHGPERLAVIEKALKLKPDLFGDPKPIPASERIHELEERVSELEGELQDSRRDTQTARLFLGSIKLYAENALAALDASKDQELERRKSNG